MALIDLDHVNIRTARLAEMVQFYGEVLGLREGPRPGFAMGGAWLYCGERAVVHLVEVATAPNAPTPQIEHFALTAADLKGFLCKLRDLRVPYHIAIVPDLELRQVFLRDPDGNRIEISFQADEQADLSDFDGCAA
ncbi:MAG: VOC family protein [Pseudomonadota bacterium]